MLSRRDFLAGSLAGAAATQWAAADVAADNAVEDTPPDAGRAAVLHVPHVQLTTGPRHHWFGYYDKEQFSPDGSQVLSGEVDFEGRSPRPDDTIGVGLVPAAGGDFQPLGTSAAWGWQQGCMLQWVPGRGREVMWNDRLGQGPGARFVSRFVDLDARAEQPDRTLGGGLGGELDGGLGGDPGQGSAARPLRTLPHPIYALAPDGSFGVTTDFERIQNMRPGYGYAGVPDPHAAVRAPEGAGIRRVDLRTGQSRLLVSYAEMAAIPHRGESLADRWHYFNHLLVDPLGERMVFLHRWRDAPARRDGRPVPGGGGFQTRMVTCRCDDGGDRYLLDASGATSHFIWRDPEHICAWTRVAGRTGFHLFRDRTGSTQPVGADAMPVNGHNTYLPGTGGEWILNDTYPDRRTRMQTVYLFHGPSGRRHDLAAFHSPPRYTGEVRTDLHPRSSRDGRHVVVDSPHTGGRQLHRLDIGEVLDRFS